MASLLGECFVQKMTTTSKCRENCLRLYLNSTTIQVTVLAPEHKKIIPTDSEFNADYLSLI